MRAGVADIHRRPRADAFNPLERLDLIDAIVRDLFILRQRRQFFGADVIDINRFLRIILRSILRCLVQLLLLP